MPMTWNRFNTALPLVLAFTFRSDFLCAHAHTHTLRHALAHTCTQTRTYAHTHTMSLAQHSVARSEGLRIEELTIVVNASKHLSFLSWKKNKSKQKEISLFVRWQTICCSEVTLKTKLWRFVTFCDTWWRKRLTEDYW